MNGPLNVKFTAELNCNPKDTDHSVALYLRCARKREVKSTTALKHKT